MDELFEKLCGGLEDEIERQETVLAVCRAQIDAIGARDLNALEARTAALDILVREAAHAQASRAGVIAKVAVQLGLPPDRRTLYALANAAPGPWNARLQHIQCRLRKTVNETRRVVRLNARTIRRSLDFNQRLLACIAIAPSLQPAYGERGAATAVTGEPALIDQRG
ncbi:MAG: flagellar protein FlgN [Candidatus Hydrogenedentes bacterium]|nr:flagellar protein FlgN [Candidatus Hydrogenedentota bacterium]